MFNFAVCVMYSEFDREQNASVRKISQVLQLFATQAEADAADEIFMRWYDYSTEVIPVVNMPDYA